MQRFEISLPGPNRNKLRVLVDLRRQIKSVELEQFKEKLEEDEQFDVDNIGGTLQELERLLQREKVRGNSVQVRKITEQISQIQRMQALEREVMEMSSAILENNVLEERLVGSKRPQREFVEPPVNISLDKKIKVEPER